MEKAIGIKALPDVIYVMGGGRWARIIIDVLFRITPSSVLIKIFTPRNSKNMQLWVEENKFEQRVKVETGEPEKLNDKHIVAIVVNRVNDHEQAIRKVINVCSHVIVEKPFTNSFAISNDLYNMANKKGVTISTAHVFLFASYFEQFSKLVLKAGKINYILFDWSDPKSETRYSENKQYDSSLSIFADWLPHILSMTDRMVPQAKIVVNDVTINRGGATTEIKLLINEVICMIKLNRNADERVRKIFVSSETCDLDLDFSMEPGKIKINDSETLELVKWGFEERPLPLMLKAFLTGSTTNTFDERLDCRIGLLSNEVIDSVTAKYRVKQRNWLLGELDEFKSLDEDLKYALTELFQIDHYLETKEINTKLDALENGTYKSNDLKKLVQQLNNN